MAVVVSRVERGAAGTATGASARSLASARLDWVRRAESGMVIRDAELARQLRALRNGTIGPVSRSFSGTAPYSRANQVGHGTHSACSIVRAGRFATPDARRT